MDLNKPDVGCRISTSRMSDFYMSDVRFLQVVCRISFKSDVGFLQVGCRIFTSRMSDFNKSDVGFLQVGCRIFTSRMSNVGVLKSDVGWHL